MPDRDPRAPHTGARGRESPDAGLVEEWARTGNWLFRWRSYLPLLVLAALAALSFAFPSSTAGRLDNWELAGMLVSVAGLVLRAWTVGHAPAGTSGRGTRKLEAASLSTEGMYSVVRHPLYLGNLLIWAGVAATTGNLAAVAVTILVFWIYNGRIMLAEERFLRARFGSDFTRWAARTPALLPAPRLWRPYQLPFSLLFALGRDHAALYAWVAATTALEVAETLGAGDGLDLAPFWGIYFGAGTVVYVVLWRLKKDSTLLDVEGR